MISKEELNPHNYSLTDELAHNLERLYICINAVRLAYGKPMIVSSGVRSLADQQRINPAAMASNHTRACAVDISDPKGELKTWILNNVKLLEYLGLYCEDFSATPTWVHIQTAPPRSLNRFFLP